MSIQTTPIISYQLNKDGSIRVIANYGPKTPVADITSSFTVDEQAQLALLHKRALQAAGSK